MQLFVICPDGRTRVVNRDPTDDAGEIVVEIAGRLGGKPSGYYLLYTGKPICADHSIEFYSIPKEATLQIYARPLSGPKT